MKRMPSTSTVSPQSAVPGVPRRVLLNTRRRLGDGLAFSTLATNPAALLYVAAASASESKYPRCLCVPSIRSRATLHAQPKTVRQDFAAGREQPAIASCRSAKCRTCLWCLSSCSWRCGQTTKRANTLLGSGRSDRHSGSSATRVPFVSVRHPADAAPL